MDDKSLKKIEELFTHHMGIISEDFQHKMDLVVEGQQMLSEKVDRLESELYSVKGNLEMVRLELKNDIAKLAADLTAHRKDAKDAKKIKSRNSGFLRFQIQDSCL